MLNELNIVPEGMTLVSDLVSDGLDLKCGRGWRLGR
jgi:hypothetical protein